MTRALVIVFFVGVAGSLVVVVYTFVEDATEMFTRDEPAPANGEAFAHPSLTEIAPARR